MEWWRQAVQNIYLLHLRQLHVREQNEFEARLKRDLLRVSLELLEHSPSLGLLEDKMYQLWAYDFSSLLGDVFESAAETHREAMGLVVFLLAKHARVCRPDWPEPIHVCFRVYHQQPASLDDAKRLMSHHDRFWGRLVVPDGDFASGLLCMPERLYEEWQVAIRTSQVMIPDRLAASPSILRNLLANTSKSPTAVTLAGGKFLESMRRRVDGLAGQEVKVQSADEKHLFTQVEEWRKRVSRGPTGAPSVEVAASPARGVAVDNRRHEPDLPFAYSWIEKLYLEPSAFRQPALAAAIPRDESAAREAARAAFAERSKGEVPGLSVEAPTLGDGADIFGDGADIFDSVELPASPAVPEAAPSPVAVPDAAPPPAPVVASVALDLDAPSGTFG